MIKKFSKVTFARRLKAMRILRGLEQKELADKCKIPASSICHFERELTARKPSLENLMTLAQTLDISTDFLLGLKTWEEKC